MTQDVSPTPPSYDDWTQLRNGDGGPRAIFEDLQTTLRCCERLVSELASGEAEPTTWPRSILDDGGAVLCRCFSHREGGHNLTPDDVTATGWRRRTGLAPSPLRLRDHYADPEVNPGETFSVGVSQDARGKANGVAVTSAKQAALDDLTVRQTGAIAFELTRIVDRRIAEHQDAVFGELGTMTKSELDRLQVVEVAAET